MKKIILDSSVIVKWLNRDNEEHLKQADKILQDLQSGKITVFSPELAKYEIGNALLKKGLNPHQAFHSLGTVYGLPIQFVPETENLSSKTYDSAYEVKFHKDKKFTYYDASFIALAKQEKAILVTDNPKHQRQKVSEVKVVHLEDYH